MPGPSTSIKFDRCPKCFGVIKYKTGDTHVLCPKCNSKIKLSAGS